MNSKKNLNETVAEALNLEHRSVVTEEARRVMNLAGDAVKLAKIDEEVLKSIVSRILREYRGEARGVFSGIINPFLKIFGLRIVSRRDGSGKEFAPSEVSQIPVINADIDELRKIFHDIASEVDNLANANARNEARTREMESHLNTAVRDAESAKSRLSAQQSETARDETESLKYIQRMLAERGKDNPPDADGAFGQLLEVLGVTFSWKPEDDPMAFQTYTISDESKSGVSLPCLLKNNNVAVKGLVYAVKQ